MHPVKAPRRCSCSFKGSLDGLRYVAGNTFVVVFEPLVNRLITIFRSQAFGNSTRPDNVKDNVKGQPDTQGICA